MNSEAYECNDRNFVQQCVSGFASLKTTCGRVLDESQYSPNIMRGKDKKLARPRHRRRCRQHINRVDGVMLTNS